jgi:5'-nucleotidase, C-terminal domain
LSGFVFDLKLAGRVTGIDLILGGHTHDCTPAPTVVENASGRTLVTSGGSNGKFVAVLDLDIGARRVNDVRYTLLPVFSNLLAPDRGVAAAVAATTISDRPMLDEKLADAGELLYRRGNFTGTMDQVICDGLRSQLDAQIAFSPGFRWGPSGLPGEHVSMDFLLAHTAITYPDVYVQEMTGEQIKGVLEDVCDNLFNPDPYVQQGGDMVRVSGLDYSCDPTQTIGWLARGLFLFLTELLLTHDLLRNLRNRTEIKRRGEIEAVVCASRATRSRADGRNRRHGSGGDGESGRNPSAHLSPPSVDDVPEASFAHHRSVSILNYGGFPR